ncbi:hypothetical protein CUMW_262060, partial [Citrus unshiu]
AALEEEQADQIDLSCFSGNLGHDGRDNARDCWKLSDGNNLRVRSKHFCYDKTKIPAGKHLMDLVAVDWFQDTKRMDHVARRQGCAAQIDVDIGSSTVANGVLGLVIVVITTLVVDMAFLVQANTTDELPERLIGAVRVSHIELKSAVVPKLEPEIS